VQAVYDNRAGEKAELSPHELAKRFDTGLRIDTRPFEEFMPDACHCDVPFAFVRDETAPAGLDPDAPE
jgi:hypothetical protein